MKIVVFVLTLAARWRCISSASVRGPSFLETTTEVDTSALAARVENVGTLASDERVAVQAQQQALIALAQEQNHLASRMDAIEAQHDAAAHAADRQNFVNLCSPKTEGTCMVYDCDKSRGMTVCEMGACNCQPGICADGHGKCLSDKPARKLPGTYKMIVEADGSFMYMEKEGITFNKRSPQEGGGDIDERGGGGGDSKSNKRGGDIDDFPEGHWHIVVNNDDSLMFYTEKYGPTAFLTIEDINDDKDDPKWRVGHKSFTSPWAVSFEYYGKPKGQANNEFWLKHIRSKQWVKPSYPWFPAITANSVKGMDNFPGRPGALIFDPPLDTEHLEASAWHILPLWPLLLTIGVSLA